MKLGENYIEEIPNLGLTVIYLMVFLEKHVKQDSLWGPESAFVYMFIYISEQINYMGR